MKTSILQSLLGTSLLSVVSLASAADPPPPATPPAAIPGVEEAKQTSPPLLREGSFLARTPGVLREDTKRREWIFTPQAVDRSGFAREFVLLPNEALSDAARTARLAPSELTFELTGEVFIYHGKNFILPAMLSPFVPSEPAAPAPAAPVTPAASPKQAPGALPQDEEAIARELERRLAERIERLPKTAVTPPQAQHDVPGTAVDPSKAPPMRGDTQIQSRRGQLVRDNATGGWRFVFEGQLPEGGEPSMAILPCLALERIEASVRQSDVALPLSVTGTTTVFEGRTYLLPSIFRVARGGRGINP